ncbi:MAG TPA: flavin reductase family protein [Methylomirabilota bacterium]|jgi:flavin reductase (DIM6/NTAB) family NADH-FMN oxidoreductase RutF|nr:flavin reductase family protein [Methylomirabilota bacterium]
MPITAAEFRLALRHFPAGVTVVTTRHADGRPCGLTLSAFTSVSLDPPLVLVCIDHAATAYRAFIESGWFAVNVLGKSQEHLSRRFATTATDKFAGIAFREGQAGLPILDDVVAALECRVVHQYAGGDHTIFVGQVEVVSVTGGPPLVYFRGAYHHLETDHP